MKTSRQSYINVHRDAWVEVNLEYLAQNVKFLKSLCQKSGSRSEPASACDKQVEQGELNDSDVRVLEQSDKNSTGAKDVKLLAVVKADAYGHGAVMCAPTMLASGVDMLGVASIDEGLNLRDANINCDILVLGAAPVWAFECAAENDITLSIFSHEHIKACKQAYERIGKKVKVQIKIDTGMNRIGVHKDKAIEFIEKVQECDFIDLQGIFSHLACAECVDESKKQFDKFNEIISKVNTENIILHMLNTAGAISYPEYQFDMVRAGIGLYGLMPELACAKPFANHNCLKQIISLKGRITRINRINENEGISYGHTFVTNEEIDVATIPIGYADGVPRKLSNKIYGELNGEKVKQIGNITMDQMMFDTSNVYAKEGDVITLLGDNLSIDEWAKIVGTINYELTCKLKVRLPRVYTR